MKILRLSTGAGSLLLAACASGPGELPAPERSEVWEPVPALVAPGVYPRPPSDAIVLFDGKDLGEWRMAADAGKPAAWIVADGAVTVRAGAGPIATRRTFMDFQLHLEWRPPAGAGGSGQQRGNSGVFLASTGPGDAGYEVQVLACDNNRTYANGQAGSVYKQHIPLVNACATGEQWQAYDIIWTAPRFQSGGALASPAYVTVLHNGVLIQNHVKLGGETVYRGAPAYRAHGPAPLKLQDHGDAVSFRNIWIRPLGEPTEAH
jgi:hypothetical protein